MAMRTTSRAAHYQQTGASQPHLLTHTLLCFCFCFASNDSTVFAFASTVATATTVAFAFAVASAFAFCVLARSDTLGARPCHSLNVDRSGSGGLALGEWLWGLQSFSFVIADFVQRERMTPP